MTATLNVTDGSTYSFTFDWDNELIEIDNPYTDVLVQDLIDAIRFAEESPIGIFYPNIADASGKVSLGGGVSVGITIELLGNWQVHFWVGNYIAKISGGNLVGGPAGDPVAYSAGVQVLLIQSAASTVVATGGSALTSEQDARLTRVERFIRNKRITNPSTGKDEIYDDAGSAVIFERDVFENAAGTQAYRGQGAERVERYEEP